MGWAVAGIVIASVMWAVVEAAAIAGLCGALMGERFARCEKCGRVALTVHGTTHRDGCPHHAFAHNAHHAWATLPVHLHRPHLTR